MKQTMYKLLRESIRAIVFFALVALVVLFAVKGDVAFLYMGF